MISEVFIIVMPLMSLLMFNTECKIGQSKENKDSNREFSRKFFFLVHSFCSHVFVLFLVCFFL